MALKADRARRLLRPIVIAGAVALLSAALAACAALGDLRDRTVLLVQSLTGLRCLVGSVGPCFPCGITASDVTIYSPSGVPLFQARELRTQVNLFRYLRKDGTRELFQTLSGDGIQLALIRDPSGEWEFPRLVTPSGAVASVHEGRSPPRRFLFTNVTILCKTATEESTRFYSSVDGLLDTDRDTLSLTLSGVNERARITFTKGAVKRYELQAENFSTALLAPLASFPLPLANLALNGTLSATTGDDRNFAIAGSGWITTHDLHCPVISSHAIEGLSLPFEELQGVVNSRGIENLTARIGLAGETATLQGRLRGWDKPVLDLTATFSDFSYDRAISALPVSLHPSLPAIRLSGSLSGTFRMRLDLTTPASLDYSYTGTAQRPEILNLGQEIDIDRLQGPFLHKVRMNPEQETSILLGPENPDFIPYGKIPFSVRSAVMVAEDLGFFSHRGFSQTSIRRSLIENLKAGRVVRGGSTISMQLAKNLFLSPERTLSRKLEEALITLAIEQNLDKKRILEIYLNIIEWGNGIYGIGPAARYYFGKSPTQLSPVEAAFLASIIARPKNWSPDPLSRLDNGWRRYLRVILTRMYRMGAADFEDLRCAGFSEERLDRLTESLPEPPTEGPSHLATVDDMGMLAKPGNYGDDIVPHQ